MDPYLCKHKYYTKFFGIEIWPMGTKKCDICNHEIHLSWFWRLLYVLTIITLTPGALYIIFFFDWKLRLLVSFAIIIFAGILQWLIVRYGKYVLQNRL